MEKVIRCEECGSTLTYMRFKTNDRICRKCGHIEIVKELEKKDG
ncbi:MAG: hypothetical protein ABIG37_02430 [Nanoarchaeota archaeon]